MALKRKISKAEFEKLKPDVQFEYKQDGDNYILDADDSDEIGALRRAKDREAQDRRAAEKRARELEDELAGVNQDDLRKAKDIKKLEKSWEEKHTKVTEEAAASVAKANGYVTRTLIDKAAGDIAAQISTVPAIMKKAVADRLTVDFSGDEPVVKVLDTKGQPSALKLEELSAEFVANKDYSAIIIASKATGGARKAPAVAQQNGSAAQTPKLLSKMSPTDLVAQIDSAKQNTQQ